MSVAGRTRVRTGGEALVEALVVQGTTTVFGIPGTHNLAAYEALADTPSIRHVTARHEQGAGFMADGYARASGQFGVCLSTTGPAALNTLTPLGTAFADSVPMLAIASEVPADGVGRQKGYLHECRDQLGCYAAVTGFSARVADVAEIPTTVRDAVAAMLSGRPRPAAIDIPCDLLDQSGEVRDAVAATVEPVEPVPADVARAAELLRDARRPLIWAGGGVARSEAGEALVRLAERFDAPVFTTVLGKGTIADDHPLAAGAGPRHPATHPLWESCDLLLAVGNGFGELETGRWKLELPPTLVQVDVDPETIGRNYPASHGVVGDARLVLEGLLVETETMPGRAARRAEEVARMREAVRRQCRERSPEAVDLLETIRGRLPREAVLVNDLTVAVYWGRYVLEVYQPRTYLYPWNFCTLGYGLAGGVGAAVARPEVPVVVLCGDGGFLFNVQELATAVQEDLALTVIVFNDSAYGVLKPQQEHRYGRTFAVDLHNPDLLALAASFGAHGCRATSADQLGAALSEAVGRGGVSVIDVPVSLPWPLWPRQEAAVTGQADGE